MERPLVIFDFDGTLCNSIAYGIKIANQYASKFGYKPLEDFNEVREKSAVNYIFTHIKWYYLPFWAYLMKKEIKKHVNEISLYDNIVDQIKEIHAFADLGIISGGKRNYIEPILNRYDIKSYFSFIHSNTGTKKHKILSKYKSRRVIHIGDDIEDIRSSNRSNVKSIAVTWGTSSKKILEQQNPSNLIDSPNQLSTSIQQTLGKE